MANIYHAQFLSVLEYSNTMKLEIPWRLNGIFDKLFGQSESASVMKRNTRPHFISSKTYTAKPCLRTTPSHIPLPVQPGAGHSPICHENDIFSQQLTTYRDENWWNAQRHRQPGSLEDCPIDGDIRKRSLSIREIRERMNSVESAKTTFGKPFNFEPGLKLLNGARGGWKDMEMFIE